jgi:hypothetical protein
MFLITSTVVGKKSNGLEYCFIGLNAIPEDARSWKYVGALTQIPYVCV